MSARIWLVPLSLWIWLPSDMQFIQITENKKQYLDLLLLADEQESMVDKYLAARDMFVCLDPDTVRECVIVDLGDGIFEIKNLATDPRHQGKGYGRALIEFVMNHYKDRCREMLVGTGDSPLTLPFYKKCGFCEHHRVKNFYTDNYDHPIFEAGIQLVDMVYLSRRP